MDRCGRYVPPRRLGTAGPLGRRRARGTVAGHERTSAQQIVASGARPAREAGSVSACLRGSAAADLFGRQLEVLQAAAARLSRADGREAGTFCHDGRISVPIGISVGVATFPADGRSAAELIAVADAGLYRMKRSRRAEEPRSA